MPTPGACRRRREPLTRQRVLAVALRLADEEGIEALSMRRLARALGVEAMSLYHYVASKDDLLDGILDIVVRDIALPSPHGDPITELRQSAISAHRVLRDHPWACGLLMSVQRLSEGRLRQMDAMLACLHAAGLSADLVDRAYHALDSHILGFTLWQAGYAAGSKTITEADVGGVRDRARASYPSFADHVDYHLRQAADDESDEFEFVLDVILDGLRRAVG